jgi:general stress protein 26
MRQVSAFAELQEEFLERVRTMVYCSAATVDADGRPRSRVLHPVWEDQTGWVTTGPKTAKASQLALNPFMSLAFIADPFKPVYVECRATWQNDRDTRHRIWDLFKKFDVDLAVSWGDVESPTYAVLRLDAWRIELYDLLDQDNRKVWQKDQEAKIV